MTTTTYDRFRRAEGAWIARENGETFLNIGCWADSYDSNRLFRTVEEAYPVEFVGWDATSEFTGEDFEGNFVGDRSRTIATPAEFAAFIGRRGFVAYVREFAAAYATTTERTI